MDSCRRAMNRALGAELAEIRSEVLGEGESSDEDESKLKEAYILGFLNRDDRWANVGIEHELNAAIKQIFSFQICVLGFWFE